MVIIYLCGFTFQILAAEMFPVEANMYLGLAFENFARHHVFQLKRTYLVNSFIFLFQKFST